jgi:hypothetical protein
VFSDGLCSLREVLRDPRKQKGSVESLEVTASKSEKQIPHPAKTAGIRDDNHSEARFRDSMSTGPSKSVTGLSVADITGLSVAASAPLHRLRKKSKGVSWNGVAARASAWPALSPAQTGVSVPPGGTAKQAAEKGKNVSSGAKEPVWQPQNQFLSG